MSRQFGDATYGGNYRKNEFRKLKDGRNVYRILPPIGDLAKDGKWSVYYSIHYGYANSEGKLRPFQSSLVKNRKTKMIEVPDAALERIETFKAQLEKAKKDKNEAAIKAFEFLVGSKKAKYNVDNNHHVNALDEQGNVVVLKLRYKAKLALDQEIDRLRAEGTKHPLAVTGGRWFVFTRTGMGLDTTFKVDVLKEKLTIENVGVVDKEVVSNLDAVTVDRCLKEASDLNQLYKRLTHEEIAEVVRTSDVKTGISPIIDELFKGNDFTAEENISDDEAADNSAAQAAATTTTTTAAAPVITPAPVQEAAPAVAPAPAATVTPTVLAQAPTTPAAAPKVEVAPAPASTAKNLAEMSTDEFLATLNLGN